MPTRKRSSKSGFTGLWHIVSMETWDEDYFNEEVQAFLHLSDDSGFVAQRAKARKRSKKK